MAQTHIPTGAGLGNTAAYQKAGTPLIINGAGTHDLMFVSKALVISAVGGATTISFSGDVTELTIPSGQTVRLELRVLSFTTGANASVVVELTKIQKHSLDPAFLDVTRSDLLE